MNLQEALNTANWLLERESVGDGEPQELLSIRQMRDTLYMLWIAAGVPEILLQVMDEGRYPG